MCCACVICVSLQVASYSPLIAALMSQHHLGQISQHRLMPTWQHHRVQSQSISHHAASSHTNLAARSDLAAQSCAGLTAPSCATISCCCCSTVVWQWAVLGGAHTRSYSRRPRAAQPAAPSSTANRWHNAAQGSNGAFQHPHP